MIYDYLKNLSKYEIITPDILNFLKRTDLTEGRYKLENGVYASVSKYRPKDSMQCRFESHRKYIDIQCVLSGEEIIEITPVEGLKEEAPYDAEKDLFFYHDGNKKQSTLLKMLEGTFCVLYPEEAHKPGLALAFPKDVLKVVLKVPV